MVTFLRFPATTLLCLANLMLFSCDFCTLTYTNVDLDLILNCLKIRQKLFLYDYAVGDTWGSMNLAQHVHNIFYTYFSAIWIANH